MAFDGSAIRTLLDAAASKGAVHGIAALVVDRNGPLFHHAAGEADERTLFRNASMTKAVATTGAGFGAESTGFGRVCTLVVERRVPSAERVINTGDGEGRAAMDQGAAGIPRVQRRVGLDDTVDQASRARRHRAPRHTRPNRSGG